MKDAYYFSHDANAQDDPKCMILIDQLGMEGYGIFWALIERLRNENEYKLPFSICSSFAKRWCTSKEKIEAVIMSFGLFEIDESSNFFSIRLCNSMIAKSLKARESANKRWGKTAEMQSHANALQPHANKGKESKVKEITPIPPEGNAISVSDLFILLSYAKIALAFWELFKSNLVELNIKSPAIENANSEKWTEQIRLMYERDHRTKEEILEVYYFLKNEIPKPNFSWKRNILSTTNLRKHFDKLLIAARSEKITPQIAQEPPRKTLKIIE